MHGHIILQLIIGQALVIAWNASSATESNGWIRVASIRIEQTWTTLVIAILWPNTLLIIALCHLLLSQCIDHIVCIGHETLVYGLTEILLSVVVVGVLHLIRA